MLGLLAAGSALASEMPRPAAWPVACAAVGYGLWRAHAGISRTPVALVWLADGRLLVTGQGVRDANVAWHGPIAFLRWHEQDGRRRRVSFWSDTLDAEGRRELRLAASRATAAQAAPSMAP